MSLSVIGESNFWGDGGTRLFYDGTNGFAIGIQNGKGCKVKGIQFIGKFKPPFASDRKAFFKCRFEDFKDSICRDSRYSPYAGIIIDPFTNGNVPLPTDGGYPNLSKYYGSTLPNTSGSTATEIEECQIKGFVCAFISSPNGTTKNAEITILNKIHFGNNKADIVSCQEQEKGNVAENIYDWGSTHTIFSNGYYGSGSPSFRKSGNWKINQVNIAGAVVRFIDWDGSGFFPMYISNVFAESLGEWGNLSSQLSCSVTDCSINFESQATAGTRTLLTSNGVGVTYSHCTLRYYGDTKSTMYINGNAKFDNCTIGRNNPIIYKAYKNQ